jgi:class 3 adenylate cyclase/tetratricopeptide (TPR) repeat protein
MRCPYCRTETSAPAGRCQACGNLLGERHCPACGFASPVVFRFCGQCGTPVAEVASAVPPEARDAGGAERHARSAERRQVTVLFSDIVGWTRLAQDLDPEDLGALLRGYQAACTEVVDRYRGYTAQYLGDGVLAYFGYPDAHEDDAERAVRAGLTIVEAIPRLNLHPGVSLAVRVGIATGLVLAANLAAEGNASELAVVGETPNLAARLQNLAPANGVVIATSTRQLLGTLFELESVGEHALKGFAEPVHAYRVVRERPVDSRFEAVRDAALTPLVGRKEEINLLFGRWKHARHGEGQVVLLSGEAGIGKSRTVHALRQRLAAEPHVVLHYQCSPHHADSALHPVIAQLERMANFRPGEKAEDRLSKLEALLSRAMQNTDSAVPLFAALLSVDAGGRYPPLALEPQQQKERTLAALIQHLEGVASRQPVLVIVEDAHWIDPTSLEWLVRVIEWARAAPVMLVVTFRPDFSPDWADRSRLTMLTLNRLSRQQSATIVRQLAGDAGLADETVEQIVRKTDGVPLFIEEVTKTVLKETERLPARAASSTIAIPSSLQDSLMARLDQLASAKEVAQVCGVIGRECSYALLSAVIGWPQEKVGAAVDRIVQSGLMLRHGTPPEAHCVFKHALVQDAAYASLPRGRRQALHARTADVLVERFPETVETQPELIAHHLTAAERVAEAVSYWEKAGQRAASRSANLEAARHFAKALELLARLPDTRERAQTELAIRVVLGPTLIITRGPRSTEVRQNYSHAQRLCAHFSDSPLRFAALWGLWRSNGNFPEKQRISDDLLRVAEVLGDQGLVLQAHHTQWATRFHLGQHAACLRHVEEGLQLYRLGDYRSHAGMYGGHDPKVCACGEAAYSLWLLGHPERAVARAEEALAWARTLEHSGSLAQALEMNLLLHSYRRDAAKVIALADEIIDFAGRENFPVHKAKGLVFRGWALAWLSDPHEGVDLMLRGLASQQDVGTREDHPIFFDMLAEGFGMVGDVGEGLHIVEQALSETRAIGLLFWTAELQRRRGELMRIRNEPQKAELDFQRARRMARDQNAIALELRAAMSLARLWSDEARGREAYELLLSVQRQFTEGFATADLVEAKALMDAMA